MCNHHHRKGKSLKNKGEHKKDHQAWSRRNFLIKSGILGAAATMPFGNHILSAPAPNAFSTALNQSESERILVLIRLAGGNDGLNMIIPRGNNFYYNNRQTIGIGEDSLIPVDAENGFHPQLAELMPMWNDGVVSAIHNVGYPSPNLSHFRSTDIWASASDSDVVDDTGWLGRYFEHIMPSYVDTPPVVPPALQIGNSSDGVFAMNGPNASLSITNPQQFYSIAQNGQLYNTLGLGNCTQDLEKAFLRQMANSTFFYANSIQDAYNRAQSMPANYAYPDHYLADGLNIVAQMIKGNLGTKVYFVTLGGFDTHVSQENNHANLMSYLGGSIRAFYEDMKQYNKSQDVLMMTFSEFGRTWTENDSFGTDHGTGAPMFIVGEGIQNGVIGSQPDLSNLGVYDDPEFEHDFRDIYYSILKDWLCIDPNVVNYIMGRPFAGMPGLLTACNYIENTNASNALLGHKINPGNPFIIDLHYSIKHDSKIQLQWLNDQGQLMFNLINDISSKGSHVFAFNRSTFNIPPGKYFYRLNAGGESFTRRIEIY